jgi:hypothetical protein
MSIPNETVFVKDAFHDAIIKGENLELLRQKKAGTKFSPVYRYKIDGGATQSIYLRLSNKPVDQPFPIGFKDVFTIRKEEADAFYESLLPCEFQQGNGSYSTTGTGGYVMEQAILSLRC